jgi:hypothetical protein
VPDELIYNWTNRVKKYTTMNNGSSRGGGGGDEAISIRLEQHNTTQFQPRI